MASLTAAVAGWLIDDMTGAYLGVIASSVLSLVASTALFFSLRRWLRQLRDG
jgi:hypothetical protein